MSTLQVFKRIMAYVRPYGFYTALGIFGMMASQALAIMIPAILRNVIDHGVASRDTDYMLRAGLLVVGLGIVRGVMGFFSRYFTEMQSHRVAFDMRNEMYDKVQRLPFSYHDTAHTGSLITRSISDVDEVQRFLAFGVLDGFNTMLIVTFSLTVMFFTSPALTFFAVLPLLPLAYNSKFFAQFVETEWRKVMELLGKLGNHLQESIVGAEVVRVFARENHEINRFGDANKNLFDQQIKVVRAWSSFIPFSSVMTSMSIFLVLLAGGFLERINGTGVTVGVIVQFNAYILVMSQPLRLIGFVIMLINQGLASGRRVFEILDAPETVTDKADAVDMPMIEGTVKFENVSFRYNENLPLALQNIDFTAKPGQLIAVIGQTGSGKSTLINLIPRFYDVTAGRITIDGYDIRDVSNRSIKQQIGIILQESLLFSATIRENIAFGRPEASEEEIIAAAKAANAHTFITEFPQGYDTRVGERGVTVSGGQRQRIAIARAILMNPRILILDDATSSVDTRTEYEIQAALKNLMHGRTTFVIAQRLTSVMNADEILVVDKGRIAERGTHDQLLTKRGLYREIYDLQMADQERVRRETAFSEDAFLKLAGD